MTLNNLDLSNIITNGSVEYNSSPILRMIEKDDVLCFFKGKNNNGIGIRIIDDDINETYHIEFFENENASTGNLFSIGGKIYYNEKNKITFYQVTK